MRGLEGGKGLEIRDARKSNGLKPVLRGLGGGNGLKSVMRDAGVGKSNGLKPVLRGVFLVELGTRGLGLSSSHPRNALDMRKLDMRKLNRDPKMQITARALMAATTILAQFAQPVAAQEVGFLETFALRQRSQSDDAHGRAQEVGFLETFALAKDRSFVLQQLIPGSEEYFFYNSLHLQNSGQLADSEAMIQQWSIKMPGSSQLLRMQTRQRLLNYSNDPKRTLDYLGQELGLQLDHAPPQADRARDLPTTLDPATLDHKKLLDEAVLRDPSLEGVSAAGLLEILDRDWSMDQVRAILKRVTRVDVPGILGLIEKELRAQDSGGWNVFPIHGLLTLEQRQQLAKSLPQLLENDVFVRQLLMRLLPSDDTPASDLDSQRQHLDRLEAFVETLPPSQNSLKAVVLFHRLQLDAASDNFDRTRFIKYLTLPRNQPYYSQAFLKSQVQVPLISYQATYIDETLLPPISDDAGLIRRYLEHFFQTDDSVDQFSQWLDREYLQRIFVETKILYGIGSTSDWYAQIDANLQKAIRDRVELEFGLNSTRYFRPDDAVHLTVDVKNVTKLVVRIYQINPRNVYRRNSRAVATDIDLDGLIANAEQTISYDTPADRRHRELIDIPQCAGRGVWIVDLLGGGLRSRALIVKGQLRSTQRLTDAGHEFRIYDESGNARPTATIELGTRTFAADKDGAILIPYAEKEEATPVLLVDGQSATVEMFNHRRENYALKIGLLVESQNLLSGAAGSIIVRPQLLCNDQPVPIENLEDAELVIVSTDQDNIQSTQTVPIAELSPSRDIAHQFLVPQRLRSVSVSLNGKVLAVSRNTRERLSATQEFSVNEMSATKQIADFFLIQDAEGYLLQVRGRNGELVRRLPVTVQFWLHHVVNPVSIVLATDAAGQIQLGDLVGVRNFQASADSMTARIFSMQPDAVDWPSSIQMAEGQAYELPWQTNSPDNTQADENMYRPWTLLELRASAITVDYSSKVSLEDNRLKISALDAGHYVLINQSTGQSCQVRVAKGLVQQGFIVGPAQTNQMSPPAAASVVGSEFRNESFRVRIAGANATTRVHIVASPFVSDSNLANQLRLEMYPAGHQKYSAMSSFYVDSLRLDEEYQYVLQRQYATKYPGNLLAQPTLLLNPWDTTTTESTRQQAALGDPMPVKPESQLSDLMKTITPRIRIGEEREPSSSYEFLGKGAKLLANRVPDEQGWIEIPKEALVGCHSLTVVVVQLQGVATKTIALPSTKIPLTELRLAKSFAEDKQLSQQQRVRVIEANQKSDLGDARSTRVQVYSSLQDVMRLYGTLLPTDEFKKFAKLSGWNQLNDDEKQSTYNELACHELNVFLYFKDRPFFEKVVRPYLENKLAPQLIDEFLLDREAAKFEDLWQQGRLNAFEKILLANRLQTTKPGVRKWIKDAVDANKISPAIWINKFQVALAGSALNLDRGRTSNFLGDQQRNAWSAQAREWDENTEDSPVQLQLGGSSNGIDPRRFDAPQADGKLQEEMASRIVDDRSVDFFFDMKTPESEPAGNKFGNMDDATRLLSRSARGTTSLGRVMLFQSLDSTREWAEIQFHRVNLGLQIASLVTPNPMWQQLAERDSLAEFLSNELHLSNSTLTEALLALAVLDLPFEAPQLKLGVEEGRLVLTSPSRCVVFVESIDESKSADESDKVLIGQDIYLVSPTPDVDPQKSILPDTLVRGTAYQASVVVTNPSSAPKVVSVLTQIPQGAIALAGGKIVQSQVLNLAAYSTQQVQCSLYFPSAGEFTFYGAQGSIEGVHAASTAFTKIRVLDQPETLDKDSWGYVALWGTNDQVLEFLRSHNTQQLNLELIAFRLQDKSFFEKCLAELDSQGVFNATLWAYSVRHNDTNRISQFLSHNAAIVERIGPIVDSPLVKFDSADRYDYEHLDYRPLVIARSHQLGAKRTILNERMAAQYDKLLERIAHQAASTPTDEMSVTYYMLIQNRIDEALAHFDTVDAKALQTHLQYDYFDAYLDFYRGRYDRAAQIASRYSEYAVPRWRDMFSQVSLQVAQHTAMLNGTKPPTIDAAASDVTDPIQRMLVDMRQSQQASLAGDAPAIELKLTGGKLTLNHQNVKEVDVRYYLMDIELLFSRNPFVQQDGESLVSIQPNQSKRLDLKEERGVQTIEIPADLVNRNLLVEVSAGALSQSQVIYANSMDVTVVDSFGRLQVTTGDGLPVEKAYVKVYARRQDGQVQFYKDGYSDLRGQFDFASLSTNDLDSVQRFAILVLHPDQGALIREVSPPKR